MTDEYDVIVLGGGPVGENVADRAVQGGLTAVIVEGELVGGECSYWACMPSKALLRSPQALRAARHVGGAAEAVTGDLDVRAVLDRRDSFTSHWQDDGQVAWLESAGIDLVRGHGRLSGERKVAVTLPDGSVRTLTARQAVAISTGSDAAIPPIPGLHEANPWTSREATSAEEIPESLVVIGGGVVAVEMATAYAALGATVTVLARSGLLGSVEPFAADLVAEGLRGLGVDVRTGVATKSVARDADGVTVTTDGGDVRAAEILVATGRTPRSGDIGLETAGLPAGRWIRTDDTLRVPGVDWLYAVGDVNGRVLLTHQGKYQARAAGDVIVARAKGESVDDERWGRHVATADHAAVPQVVFSEPEVAAAGVTEAAAREAGHRVRAVDVEFSSVAGASLHADGYRGRARMVVDEDRQVLLGVTFVGPDVAELIHAATIAIAGEVPLARLWHAVPSYPTMSEVWLRLLEAYGRQSA
ncbi:dihydrolipoyl dehydrogenase family protein [Microbacterium azadirachtae]|uniref:dihydrolipoyl dehydrogenase family protein n=1 Tax=Microbacterium azadirachtae TaxID=582680 RepID=UPI000882F3D0|nr:NAD(P)/FAD-dependent oxidoreductase [Microbacterium azadirachtae]SDL63766.1 dihydrolipoamide dehydrogenase [Microbacterium azadirachtae]SEF92854.1 dihydrolipoamide dehydrogenase [Microbacterium azadirachtae]SEF95259.1 dihydrolipoamide dehydrogenase [Microbacterium azadirachtae]